MKHLLHSFMLFLCLFIWQNAWGQTVLASGSLTSKITWSLEQTGSADSLTLRLTGSGEMPDFTSYTDMPWEAVTVSGVTYHRTQITELILSSRITKIGNYAFNATSISSVNIPRRCTTIGNYAFYHCNELTEIFIPESVTAIGGVAFAGCSKLSLVHYDGRCTNETVFSCANGTNGKIIEKEETGTSCTIVPAGWEYYTHGEQGNYTGWTAESGTGNDRKLFFYGQGAGRTVGFAESETTQNPYKLNCEKYTSLEINRNVRYIDSHFCGYGDNDGFTNIKTITVESGNPYFVVGEEGALYDIAKTKLYFYPAASTATHIDIPSTVTNIDRYAFLHAENLQSVKFLGTVDRIELRAFAYATSLRCLSFATGTAPSYYSPRAFEGVPTEGVVLAKANTDAFTTFTSSIGSNWTFGVGSTGSYISSDGTLYVDGEGAYTTPSSSANWYSQRSSIKKIVVGEGITNIGSRAFENCSNVTEVTLNNNGYIDYYAFLNCSALTRVNIGSGVTGFKSSSYFDTDTGKYVDRYPFSYCSKLATVNTTDLKAYCSISGLEYLINSDYGTPSNKTLMVNGVAHSATSQLVIPEGVTSISKYALHFSNVTKIKIPSTLNRITDNNFENHTYLTEITVPSFVASIGNYAFKGCTSLQTATINNNGNIGYNAFQSCTSLQTVTLNNNGNIGNEAFYGCTSLQTVTLNNNGYIDYSAFLYCYALTRVNIGSGVTGFKGYSYIDPDTGNYVYWYPFSYCSKLATVNTTDLAKFCSISNIEYLTNNDYGTAKNKTLLINGVAHSSTSELVIPEGVTSISKCAFYGFTNLSKIKIPSTATSVGSNAFSACTNLERIICLATTCPSTYASIATYPGDITLKVPRGTASLYRAADVWKDFNVVEGELKTEDWTMLTHTNRVLDISEQRVVSWSVSDEDVVFRNGTTVYPYNFAYDGTTENPYKMATITAELDNGDLYVCNIKVYPRVVMLTDGIAYKNTEDIDVENISYTRTFNATAGKWQCLYVPFDIEVTDDLLEDFDFAKLYMVSYHDANNNGEIEDNEPLRMVFSRIYAGKTLHANMPYYIRSKSSGKKTIEVTNTTLKAAANGSVNCSTTEHEYTLVGIYNTTNINGRYTMASDGTFSYYTKDTNLKANRWYMEVTSRTGSGVDLENYARPIEIVVEGDEETTGIADLEDKASDPKNNKIYTLDGRQVTDYDTLPSGIYIINGKKIFKK